MVYWIAGHTNRFKVLVDHDGVFNPKSMYGTTEELWFVDWEFGGTPYALKDSLYEKWSPLNFAQNWRTPMLVVHSQLDYRVDLSEGYQAFTALKKMGVPAKFLYFPDEGHWGLKPRNRRLWWNTVLDWLDQYLQPAVATGAPLGPARPPGRRPTAETPSAPRRGRRPPSRRRGRPAPPRPL